MTKVLVTGASGFIGGRVAAALRRAGAAPRLGYRTVPDDVPDAVEIRLDDVECLRQAAAGMSAVVHCAGYAHAHGLDDAAARARHVEINRDGAVNMATAAAQAGVGVFVLLSSVKAAGLERDAPVTDETSPLPPDTAYGAAKRAAEDAVLALGREHGMRVVVLRPAMVYGRGGRGNLERMAAAIAAGWFPPLPETGNRRSLVHVDDLVDAVQRAIALEVAHGVYIVADPRAHSGRALYDALRRGLGKPAARWRCPAAVLRAAGRLGDVAQRLGGRPFPVNSALIARLLDSECYSAARIGEALGWQARVALDAGVAEMLGAAEGRGEQ